ncbi:MAG TPA: hypothetical protein VL400_16970, partial [Polyangiaceae bacterium]|nr:hypothetical protein [Polyangiaceae bacterium]
MRRLLWLTGGLALVVLALFAIPAREPAVLEAGGAGDGPRVGIVFDVGGRGDKSFNDGAWAGAERAQH